VTSRPNARGASDLVWQWGQFLDHDLDLTDPASPAEPFPVPVPAGDPWFDPLAEGDRVIPLFRSHHVSLQGVREQVNEITSWIDASMVYGSDDGRARALRTLDGTGRLRTSAGELLPFNEDGLPNGPDTSARFFLAGDVRANEQVGLTAMHTLFVREHNAWADRIRSLGRLATPVGHQGRGRAADGRLGGGRPGLDRELTDEEIYQLARALVIAEIQSITYHEFLPVLLGRRALGRSRGYDPDLDARVSNEFSTASYRFGHSMLSGFLQRVDAAGNDAPGPLPLANAFFEPSHVLDHGIDALLRGLASQRAQEIDAQVVDDVRNFLFGPPGAGGFDLASLNLQRGRDHGLPSYNGLRRAMGLRPVRFFREITSDPRLQQRLAGVYGDVEAIDAWIGGLSEDHVDGALVGPLLHAVLSEQFRTLRDGDRFWFERGMSAALADFVRRQTLAVIVRRNTDIGAEFPDHPFLVRP